jgi:penicillin-binding protein-related factor A (putative recombinase)
MTDSEVNAQKLLKKEYGREAYIKKIPDFKQTGSMNGGLPDYLVIHNDNTVWWEIKSIDKRRKSFSINEFTDQQLVEFNKMIRAGACIKLLVYFDKVVKFANIKDVFEYFKENERKSIPKNQDGVWYEW